MTPEVSVILPFRNAEGTLPNAIESILNQSLKNLELLLIDNASTDRSTSIARNYLSDPRVKLINEAKVGVVHAANAGIVLASAPFIARMDADDWSFPDRLGEQLDFLKSNPDVGLVSGLIDIPAEAREGFRRYIDWVNGQVTSNEISKSRFVELPMVNPSIMVRRPVYEKHGLYHSGDFPEDYEFFLRLQLKGVRMAKIPNKVLVWNDLPDRVTRTHPQYSEKAFNLIKAKYLAAWLKENNSHHPDIWVWGAGKQARQKSEELENHGVRISGYVDVKANGISGTKRVLHFEDLPGHPDRFIASYVSNWGARAEIRTFLLERGWQEFRHFILAG